MNANAPVSATKKHFIAADALLTFEGETNTVAEWARRTGSSVHSIGARLDRGWDLERALLEPTRYQALRAGSLAKARAGIMARIKIPCPALTTVEAAQMAGVSKAVILRAVDQDALPRRYLGGALAFQRAEIESWMAERTASDKAARRALLHKKERQLAQLRIEIAALRGYDRAPRVALALRDIVPERYYPEKG